MNNSSSPSSTSISSSSSTSKTSYNFNSDSKTTLSKLLELNKKTLFDKLKSIERKSGLVVVLDLIKIVSNNPGRDIQLVNDFSEKYMVNYSISRNGIKRKTRLFTKDGIKKYLNCGNIIDYKTVCEYYQIEPVDLELKKMKQKIKSFVYKSEHEKSNSSKYENTNSLEHKKSNSNKSTNLTENSKKNDKIKTNHLLSKVTYYYTNRIVRWLFNGKRRQNKYLKQFSTKQEIYDIYSNDKEINQDKLQFLIKEAN